VTFTGTTLLITVPIGRKGVCDMAKHINMKLTSAELDMITRSLMLMRNKLVDDEVYFKEMGMDKEVERTKEKLWDCENTYMSVFGQWVM